MTTNPNMIGYNAMDDPYYECPECDGAGCEWCRPDPGAAADYAYDTHHDDTPGPDGYL